MDPDYASRYAELYRSHWWWRSRESIVLREIGKRVPRAGWQRGLDVGCGDGLFLQQLSLFARTVEGLEVAGSLVSDEAAKRHTIHIGALDELFEPSGSYDFTSMLDVLEHIAEPLPALQRLREIIAPGGILLITVPAFQTLWTSHDDINCHHVRYTRRALARLVEEAGFSAIESRYFFHWLVAPKWVVGRAERVLGRRLHQAQTPPRIVNGLLYWISRLEQAVVSPLFRWLPGSSILLMAQRAPDGGQTQ
jgi:2-polyprenyl-3-methyl-5-hydroxy-6-metoxy-1,4-benzoquinol methylase